MLALLSMLSGWRKSVRFPSTSPTSPTSLDSLASFSSRITLCSVLGDILYSAPTVLTRTLLSALALLCCQRFSGPELLAGKNGLGNRSASLTRMPSLRLLMRRLLRHKRTAIIATTSTRPPITPPAPTPGFVLPGLRGRIDDGARGVGGVVVLIGVGCVVMSSVACIILLSATWTVVKTPKPLSVVMPVMSGEAV
ncbi:hypothetical protein BC835DRAFT_204752 [Cytidiella melzeri]|nr:hypothetical protein BC835DRAFT_204752 [Cytidiella melzeri]